MNIKTTNKITAPVFALLALILFGATIGTAAPHDLDPTFGNGGKVITPEIGAINDIAIQPDGKIVAVSSQRRLVRYNADGSLDSSFGTGGIVILQLASDPKSVAIQADGKIVVAGRDNNRYNAAIVRYNGDGTLDTTFNGTGYIITSNHGVYVSAIAIQPDGKIVFVPDSSEIANIYRFNSNGTPDTSFGGTGRIVIPNFSARAVAIQPDGKIVVVGWGGNDFPTFRINTDGSPDASFGSAGRAITYIPDIYNCPECGDMTSWGNQIIIQSDGKILVKGSIGFPDFNPFADFPVVIRNNPNGTPDTSFGINGILQGLNLNFGDMAVQPDGKIVTAFKHNLRDFGVARYNAFGSPDTTFNGEGWVSTYMGSYSEVRTMAIQADGKIVVAGYNGDGALVRYQGGSNASPRTRFDFDGDGRADVSVFRPSDRSWYLNQSTNGFSAAQWGLSTDKLAPADYDGDGKTDISVYRDGTWYWLNSSNNSFNVRQFGITSDIPVPANYYTDGNGRSELAVYRNGVWWILNLSNNQVNTIQFGLASDKPVAADYDGDGRTDQAVYRGSGEWHINRSSNGYTVIQFGLATDKPIPADYDGDGKTDLAVYRNGTWYLRQSVQGWAEFNWGLSSDTPAPADYDGDGRADAAVFRDGIWYLRQTTNGISIQQFGLTNDKPIPAAYLP